MTSKKTALLVVNMTNEFLFKEYGSNVVLERAQRMIPSIKKLEEEFIARHLPVIYLTDRHLPSDYEIKKWGPHSMKGMRESELAEGMLRGGIVEFERRWKAWDLDRIDIENDLIFEVEKGTYSGFTDSGGQPTALHALLNTLGIQAGHSLYIVGLHSNGGILHTAADAWFRGFHPVLVSDCTDGFDDPDGRLGMNHSRALEYAKYWYQADVALSSDVPALLPEPQHQAMLH